MTDELYNRFGEFTVRVFHDATPMDHIAKLRIEIDELENDPHDIMEFADCILAILGAAYKTGFTFDQINNALERKISINQNRTWVKMADGTYQHV